MIVHMGMISEVKCARCDRRYSGIHSRCPFCGAHRVGKGKYSGQSDDNKGKMIIGILIMAVLVVAVAVLLVSSLGDKEEVPEVESTPPPSASIPGSEDVDTRPGLSTVPPPTVDEPPESTSPPEPVVVVEAVTITYMGSAIKNKDFTLTMAEKTIQLGVKITPSGVEEEIVWASSNSDVFEVVATDTTGTKVKVTAIKAGTATLTVTVGGVTDECIVRIK